MRKLIYLIAVGWLLCSGCGNSVPVSAQVRRAHDNAAAGKWAEAQSGAEKILRQDPRNVPALLIKALACERDGKLDPALDAALQAVKSNPNSFAARYTLGRLYSRLPERRLDAIDALKPALTLNPDDGNTLVLLSEALIAGGNYRGALPYVNALGRDERYRNSAAIKGVYGHYHLGERRYPEAVKMFLDAYNQKKTDPVAVWNLALVMDYYAQPRNVANARALYRHYLKISTERPEFAVYRRAAQDRLRQLERVRR